MVKLNRRYHIRRKGIGKGRFRHNPSKSIRLGVRAIIIRNGKYLLVQRLEGRYEFPGGKVDKGESTSLKREIKEETNLDITSYRFLSSVYNSRYRFWTNFYLAEARGRIKLQAEELKGYVFATRDEALRLNLVPDSKRILLSIKSPTKDITNYEFLNSDFDGDGVKNKDDCYPFDSTRQHSYQVLVDPPVISRGQRYCGVCERLVTPEQVTFLRGDYGVPRYHTLCPRCRTLFD